MWLTPPPLAHSGSATDMAAVEWTDKGQYYAYIDLNRGLLISLDNNYVGTEELSLMAEANILPLLIALPIIRCCQNLHRQATRDDVIMVALDR